MFYFLNKEKYYEKLSKIYDEEIRLNCEKDRKLFIDCIKRLNKVNECNYYKNIFESCTKKFDLDFKERYQLNNKL